MTARRNGAPRRIGRRVLRCHLDSIQVRHVAIVVLHIESERRDGAADGERNSDVDRSIDAIHGVPDVGGDEGLVAGRPLVSDAGPRCEPRGVIEISRGPREP